ncbi:C45 family autoproteolytic acyltransferase/hydolase [Fulvivirga imtechensis]|nr:C45 family peptidase [Fulvivirga imtechensis]
MKKKLKIGLGILLLLVVLVVATYYLKVRIEPPLQVQVVSTNVIQKAAQFYESENGSWLRKNDKSVWEMSINGTPYERGMAFGALAEQLQMEKEAAFVGEIKNRIPSDAYLGFLKLIVGWFNRDLDDYVPQEYLHEIYGASHYMPDSFDFVAPKFHRALSYHAAHDIGHALQNMNLVGCTSFAATGQKTENGKLLIGRNFDFYFGGDFAKDVVLAVVRPTEGHQFISVTWACFSGVVSGMNEKGLTVTLNSAKSDIPGKGKMPVSLIARQILQYASNIEEAYEIAQSYESFVSETFLIGSKTDGRVALIEKTPEKTALYSEDDEDLIVTNHFQSHELKNTALNLEYMGEEVSTYRYQRVAELMDSLAPLTPGKVAYILRDKQGQSGKNIGLANEKAINQLLAHHSVIFSPEEMKMWVSSPPYQLGNYLAYDLISIFQNKEDEFTYTDSVSIAPDPFLYTHTYENYERFVTIKEKIQRFLYRGDGEKITAQEELEMVKSNSNSFLTYYYLGDYFKALEDWEKAKYYYETGLTKEIAKVSEKEHMENGLAECRGNLQQ